jgi:hypothetical protein
MHQRSKILRESSTSTVGVKHIETLLDSLSEKLLGSKGITQKSIGCHVTALVLFCSIGICLLPFVVEISGPKESVSILGKVVEDIMMAFLLFVICSCSR